jgi:hypothetical protein
MGTIKALIKDLNAAPAKIKAGAQMVLDQLMPSLITDFQARAPVDTGTYKASWIQFSPRFGGPGVIASAGAKNIDPKAAMMEYGATPRTAPWYFPNSRKSTGKLSEVGSRIWAGGLQPGHSLTVGGAIDPVLFKNKSRQLQIANAVAKQVLRVI